MAIFNSYVSLLEGLTGAVRQDLDFCWGLYGLLTIQNGDIVDRWWLVDDYMGLY